MSNLAVNDDEPSYPWPWYVRAMAVLYVLSYPLQVVIFFSLCATGAYMYARRGQFDATQVALAAGRVGTLILCSVYRSWFVAWGRRNYPDGKP